MQQMPLAALPTVQNQPLAQAQSPLFDKPVRLLVVASPGRTTDTVARFVEEPMHQSPGVPIFVEDRPDADGTIGSEAVV